MNVSVIIPTYNRAHTLARALRSVLSQTVDAAEIIVVDDHSTDETKRLVSEFEGVRYVINSHHRGPGGARNEGIDAASEKYVAFLDSDDEWFPKHLEESQYCLKTYDLDASYALWYRQRGDSWEGYSDDWLDLLVRDLNLKATDDAILLGDKIAEYTISKPFWCFHTDTLVVKRHLIHELGMFDEELLSSEDLEFSYRLLLESSACLIDKYHALYYEGDDNIVALHTEDPVKTKAHAKNTVKALKKIGHLMESAYTVDAEKCRAQLNRKIEEYEVLC